LTDSMISVYNMMQSTRDRLVMLPSRRLSRIGQAVRVA
jgi:hypothetical protein